MSQLLSLRQSILDAVLWRVNHIGISAGQPSPTPCRVLSRTRTAARRATRTLSWPPSTLYDVLAEERICSVLYRLSPTVDASAAMSGMSDLPGPMQEDEMTPYLLALQKGHIAVPEVRRIPSAPDLGH